MITWYAIDDVSVLTGKISKKKMGGTGFEPVTSCVSSTRSNQLS
jgi:hypothetical protein